MMNISVRVAIDHLHRWILVDPKKWREKAVHKIARLAPPKPASRLYNYMQCFKIDVCIQNGCIYSGYIVPAM